MHQPPKNVPPRTLFRLLAGGSRPRIPVELPWLGVSGLSVYALASHELDEVVPADKRLDEVEEMTARTRLVARCLYWRDRPAYTEETAMQMRADDAARIYQVVVAGLGTVSPTYSRSSTDAWVSALRVGARDVSNIMLRRGVLAARHIVSGMKEPVFKAAHLFFDQPLSKLTDGQWMAFDAAWSTV